MRIIVERDLESIEQALHEVWQATPTFALVAEKSGVPIRWVEENLKLLPVSLQADHFVLLTSGSTGRPKLVVGSKRRAEDLTRALHERQAAQPVEESILALPLAYCYAFVNQWLWARVHQRRLVATPGFARPPEFLDRLQRAKQAQICLVRSQVPLLETYAANHSFPGVLRVHFAGSRFPQEQLPFLRERFPHAQIYNNYGCTEAMPRLCLRLAEEADTFEVVGSPLPGVRLMTSAEGELTFQSPYGAVAYIDEEGFHAIADGMWVPTGDLGFVDPEGRCHVTGRLADVFKRHGEKISLSLVQQALTEHWPGQVAFYREEDRQGEPGYVVVLAPVPNPEQVQAVLLGIRKRFSRPHWPLRVESVAALPLLPNAKIDATKLPLLDSKNIHWYYRA